jgi:[acyl-carrier-protein] S-malonyltransferase
MSIAVVFPGQGSQRPGIGAPWVGTPAWRIVTDAEDVLGRPLARLLLDAPAAELDETENAQMTMLLTGLMAWHAAAPRLDETPVALGGHSLGQVTAVIAAGVVSFADGIRLAAERGRATAAASVRRPGRMVALLGSSLEKAATFAGRAPGECWIANDNAPAQVVLAGTPDGVAHASAAATHSGIKRVVQLPVRGAFHTPLMTDARDSLTPVLAATAWLPGWAPVLHNADAEPHEGGDGWAARLAAHLVEPVRWRECQERLAALGATRLIECGASTLAALARRTVPTLDVASVTTPESLDAAVST